MEKKTLSAKTVENSDMNSELNTNWLAYRRAIYKHFNR